MKSFKKLTIKNRIFIWFLCSYFLLLMIPVSINWFSHKASIEIIKDFTTKTNTNQLLQVMEDMDSQLTPLNSLAIKISNDKTFRTLSNLTQPVSGEKYLLFQNYIQSVYNHVFDTLDELNYYIYLYKSDYIVTPDSIYSPELYFSSILKNYKPYSQQEFKQWQSFLQDNEFNNQYLNSQTQNFSFNATSKTLYLQSIPLDIDNNYKGVFVVNFGKLQFQNLFSRHIDISGSYASIEDKDGNKIANIGEENGSPNEPAITTSVTSPLNGWKYVIVTPENVLFQNLNKMQNNYYTLLGFIFIIGVGFAFLFTTISFRPISGLVTYISSFIGDNHTYSTPMTSISTGINKLLDSNMTLQKNIDEQKPFLLNSFLGNLLMGKVYNQQEMVETAKYLQIDISGSRFFLAHVRINNDNAVKASLTQESLIDVHIWRQVVRNTILANWEKNIIAYDVDLLNIVLIFNLDSIEVPVSTEEFVRETDKKFTCINSELKKTYNMNIFTGISSSCHSPMDLWQSFHQAEQCLTYTWSKNFTIWYDSITQAADDYYYPQEMSQMLQNLAKIGNYAQIEDCLDIIYSENFVRRTLEHQKCRDLMVEIRATINRSLSQIKNASQIIDLSEVKSLGSQENVTDSFVILGKIYKAICNFNTSNQHSNDLEFINKVQSYIEKHYTDPDLGLYKVASQFNLSESYFSTLFKEQASQNFADYLEKLRLDKSIELLKTTSQTIDAIALSVGYNSAQSFRRAFKKIHAISPTAFRK